MSHTPNITALWAWARPARARCGLPWGNGGCGVGDSGQGCRDHQGRVRGRGHDTVHGYWATLPEESRPKFSLYGLSLGSYGVGRALNSISIVNEPIAGALMSGPPFVNALHKGIVANREPGTPPWQPIYRQGRTVRFTAEQNGFGSFPDPWGPTRLVHLQRNSDPVVPFSPDLALQAPDCA